MDSTVTRLCVGDFSAELEHLFDGKNTLKMNRKIAFVLSDNDIKQMELNICCVLYAYSDVKKYQFENSSVWFEVKRYEDRTFQITFGSYDHILLSAILDNKNLHRFKYLLWFNRFWDTKK